MKSINAMKKKYFVVRVLVFVFLLSISSSLFAGFYNDKYNLSLKGALGYGYSFFGIARGSSFNINPGTGLGVNTGFLFNYKNIALDTNFHFSTVSDTHYGADGKQFTTVGSGKIIILDPKLGYFKRISSQNMNYLFLYGGFRYWTADYAYSKIGSADYPQDDSMQGMGFTAGGRYVSYFTKFSYSWPIVLSLGAFISMAPIKALERNGETLEVSEQGGFTPGFEVSIGMMNDSYGLAFLLDFSYDLIASKFKLKEDAESALISSTSGLGSGKIYFSVIKNMNVFDSYY